MPTQGITFDGQYIGLPGVYYADSVSSSVQPPPPVTPPLLFIGYGWGPQPKTVTTFTNPQNLINALRGSPAAAFVPFMATPSPQLNGAAQITFIDASQNTQSAAALLTSGGTTMTTLTSVLYGPPSNQLSVLVQNGTFYGRKVTLSDGYSQTAVVGDNLTVPFVMAYSGAAGSALTYSVVTGAVTNTFSVTSPVAGESLAIPIGAGAYSTVTLLVEYLNGTSNYYAQLMSSSQGQLPSASLSAVTGTLPLPTAGVLNYVPINAHLQDIAFWVNQFAGTLASATAATGLATVAGNLPVTGSALFFSGARGVPPINSDYATALNIGLSTPAWTVFCDSNSLAVQALLAQHCEMAGQPPNSAWRRGFTGSSIGDSIAATETNSQNLNAYQMTYAYPGIWRINTVTGLPQLYGGLYTAACAAAMATGNQIALPLTNKTINATGVEQVNAGTELTTSQVIALQNAGVMVVYTPNGSSTPTIVSDVTCWQSDNNAANTSSQQVACRFWLAYSMIAALQPYVGTIASPVNEIIILNAAKRTLNSLIYTGGSSSGVLASWVNSSLQLIFTGSNQLAAVSFSATLVSQNRFITEYASIQPLSFTISVAT
jgi:hypothetical protein